MTEYIDIALSDLVFRRLQLKFKNWPITNVNMVDREGFMRVAYAAALE